MGRAAVAGHTPDCDEAEVCMSQRGPESGADRDRFIVGSKFWSPPLGSKALTLSTLKPSPACTPRPHPPRAVRAATGTQSEDGASHTPGGLESLELLQERGELLRRRRRQVPQSRLFPERTLWELAAAEKRTGMRWAGHRASAALLTSPAGPPIPADQLQKLLVLQLLVQGGCRQLLLLLQPLLVHVSLSEGQRVPAALTLACSAAPAAIRQAPTSRPCSLQRGVCSPAVGVARVQGQRAHDPTS